MNPIENKAIEELKKYCQSIVDFSDVELNELEKYFNELTVKKKHFLLKRGEVCNFIYFINQGCVRHFHVKEGEEITCDISMEETFITDFKSFNSAQKSEIAFQTLEETNLLCIDKDKLEKLYQTNPKFEELGRKIAEKVASRSMDIAMSLASDKPEKRYEKLLKDQSEIFQRVPQKYIANLLGIKPESLSRIRKRVFKKLKS